MAIGTSYRTPGTLPPQTSGFVGRGPELARTRELLRGSRLVTITGPGGVGKTRLAVHAAAEAAGGYRDGAHLIDLSAVRAPGLLVHDIVAGLPQSEAGAGDAAPGTPLDQLIAFLRDRELLLILDTCEHVIDAVSALADVIGREAAGVTVLVTSRQPLDVGGEALLELSPLPVPDADSATAGRADAVELFAQRAAAAVPGFSVTGENLADVITVCERLDGIPLAIELAAIRLRALPLREMAERIDGRLRLLTGGRRSGTPRHQTLRTAIEWSYDLCTPAEQLVWARLSVFAAGFDVQAAEDVCAGGDLPRALIGPALAGLADKSLLVRDNPPGPDPAAGDGAGPGFRLLDTIREFGAERLRRADARAEAAARGRFIAHYLALAEDFERDPVTDQVRRYQRLRRAHANLRAAFDYALDIPGNDGAAAVLATSLFLYWRISGLLREGEYWLNRVLPRCPKRSVVRARALATRGHIRVLLGDFASGPADAEAAIAMAAPYSDQAVAGRAYSALSRALTFRGDLAEAQAAAERAAVCLASVGDALGLAVLDMVDAMLRLQTREIDACYESAVRGLGRLPDDEVWCSAYLYNLVSTTLVLRGDIGRAWPPACRSLAMKSELGDQTGIAFGLSTQALIAAGQRRSARAAWLVGACAPLWERTGRWYAGAPASEELHQATEEVVRADLGDERYWKLRAAGAAAPLEYVIRRALADADDLDEPVDRADLAI
jgi:non-specific serine/threonine protein kinase